jgi:tripartite-type tricarboxylate transporter receptor subunit TctC
MFQKIHSKPSVDQTTMEKEIQMKNTRFLPAAILVQLLSALLLLGTVSVAAAQEKYPSRPITFIVPWGAGGGADQTARATAHIIEPMLGVSIPVVNVPGATGQSGMAKFLAAPADGYTMQIMTGETVALLATRHPKFKFSDLIPLAVLIRTPSGFYVKEDSPWKNWQDVEKAAKERMLKIAITGFGSPDDLIISYYKHKGLKLQAVPYKASERYTSVIAGHVDVLYEQPGDVKSFLTNKQIRPVIFFYDKRFAPFPNTPVSTEFGDHITLPQVRIVVVKAGTDPKKVKILEDALNKMSNGKEYKDFLKTQYGDPNSYMSGDQAFKFLDGWLKEARAIMKETGMKSK